jgi:hypothetical protein
MLGKVMSIILQPQSISTLISPMERFMGFFMVQLSGFSIAMTLVSTMLPKCALFRGKYKAQEQNPGEN